MDCASVRSEFGGWARPGFGTLFWVKWGIFGIILVWFGKMLTEAGGGFGKMPLGIKKTADGGTIDRA